MTTKEKALHYVKKLGEQKIISKEELIEAFDAANIIQSEEISPKKLGIAGILYYIGGAIVFLGIAILLGQNWINLGFATKVLATFGSGIAAYFVGLAFSCNKRTEAADAAFYLIFSLVTPIGLCVILDHMGYDLISDGTQSLIWSIMLSASLFSLSVLRKNVFIFFSILFGTFLFFSLTSWMVGNAPYFNTWKFYIYRILAIGVAYILMGIAFTKNEPTPLTGFLYGFGILGFLSAAFGLGEWKPNQNVFWELIYPGLVFGAMFLSVPLKSKAFLIWGTIFFMAYIFKITVEYFSSGLGWPLTLVIAGLAMIGVGYVSLSIKKAIDHST